MSFSYLEISVIFHGIRTSVDKEPYSFVIFQGGNLDPSMSKGYDYISRCRLVNSKTQTNDWPHND